MKFAPSGPVARRLVSLVIVVVLGAQAVAALGLTPGPVEKSPFLWPFLDYPMYSTAHYEGEGIPRYRVVGTTADGREMEIDRETLGTDFWIFRNAFLFSFRYPGMRDELPAGVELFETRHGVRLVAVRLENRPLVLTRDGAVDGELRIEGTARRDDTDDAWHWEVP